MLVVTSNWCVSDGTLATGPTRGLIDRFRDEVRRSSLRLGFRHDGIYRPVEGVDVVLAGDTFDWLVSREWIGETRPWETGSRAAAALERVAAGSRRRSGRLLATLTAWTRRGIEIPLADRRGRPTPGVCRRVPVRVAVLCGGRDRWLDRVVNEAVPPGLVVGRCWSDGDVTVWHGTEFDPLWAADGGEPTLGESLAVDLIARFGGGLNAVAVLRPLAGGLMRRLAAGRILDAPLQLAAWLAAIDRSDKLSPAARQSLFDTWNRSVGLWHRSARRLPPQGEGGIDLVGLLAEWMELKEAAVGRRERHPLSARLPVGHAVLSDAAATIVLGHPTADLRLAAAWQTQVVCLGRQTLPVADGLGDDDAAPKTVVIHPGRERRQVDWLPMTAAEQRAGNCGVWISAGSWTERRVVDAA